MQLQEFWVSFLQEVLHFHRRVFRCRHHQDKWIERKAARRCIFVGGGGEETTCSQRLNSACIDNCCPGYRTCSFQYQLNSLGSIHPCCHITALVTIQTHKESLSSQVPIHSWVERVHIQVKCLAQGHSATLQQLRPIPKISQSSVTGHSHHAMMPCMYIEYIL